MRQFRPQPTALVERKPAHAHTLERRGRFPEMVAEWYRTHNYNFLGVSDHNVLGQGMRWMKAADIEKLGGDTVLKKYEDRFGSAWVKRQTEGNLEYRLKPLDEFRPLVERRGKFIMIPSEEISDKAEGVPVHINASNVREVIELSGKTVREAIEATRSVEEQAKKGGPRNLSSLESSQFRLGRHREDIAHAVTDRYFEVFNGHPGVNQEGDTYRPGIDRLWDIANTIRLVELKAAPLYGVGTDDSHSYHGKPNASRPVAAGQWFARRI